MVDELGKPTAAPFNRMQPATGPGYSGGISEDSRSLTGLSASTLAFRQTLPSQESAITKSEPKDLNWNHDGVPPENEPGASAAPAHPKDRALQLTAKLNSPLKQGSVARWDGRIYPMGTMERAISSTPGFMACIQLDHGLAADFPKADLPEPAPQIMLADLEASRKTWSAFWSKSGVGLEDELLGKDLVSQPLLLPELCNQARRHLSRNIRQLELPEYWLGVAWRLPFELQHPAAFLGDVFQQSCGEASSLCGFSR